jgi:UPF0716 protein FxsA
LLRCSAIVYAKLAGFFIEVERKNMLRLLLLLVIGMVVEISLWVFIAQFISGWWIFMLTVLAFVLGLNLLRGSVSSIMPQLQQMQMTGQMNSDSNVSKQLGLAIAGFLLMLPGFISDVLAVLLLIPAVQKAMQAALTSTMQKRQQAMMQQMMNGMGGMNGMRGAGGNQADMMAEMMRRMQEMQGGTPSGDAHRPTVIDGEARRVEPDVKRIKSANDE